MLSEDESSLLADALAIHLEGLRAAKEEAIDDPTVYSDDIELLDMMAQFDNEIMVINRIRKALTDDNFRRSVHSSHDGAVSPLRDSVRGDDG